ncbi:MAG: hypothetical protein Ta2F_09000 [Termitinemataceae bacterium]|nr:MAG: hypothetical protein Ta2F_09000 [Termitinemataceae bacterium]
MIQAMRHLGELQKNHYTLIMKFMHIFILILTLLQFTNCDTLQESMEKSDTKTIIIIDSDPNYEFRVSKIGKNNYILVALVEEKPNTQNIDVNELFDSNIALGKVQNNMINLPIYQNFLDHWTSTGSFWVICIELNSRATYASNAYISKEKEDFDAVNTYLTNKDFMLPVYLNVDLGNLLEDLIKRI